MKKCSKCKTEKGFTEFHKNERCKQGLNPRCRACVAADRKGRYSKEKTRARDLWANFHITADEYNELLVAQDFSCAVCKRHQSNFKKNLSVDHDHSCCPQAGKSCGRCVRGLLCQFCNTSLGSVRDDVTVLKSMIAYLEGGAV